MKNITLWLAIVVLGMTMACGDDEPAPEAIEITVNDFQTTISENPTEGQVIGSLSATTNRGSLTYSITTQSNAGALLVDNTGQLTVGDPLPFDFETNQVITANVSVTNEDVSEQVTVTVNITDENEEVITFDESVVFNVTENAAAGVPVGTVAATSSSGESITYELISLQPEAVQDGVLTIDAGTGLITTADNAETQIDFEQLQTITAVVQATSASSITAQTTITINVLDIAEIRFTSGYQVTIQENTVSEGDQLLVWDIESDRAIESYELTDTNTGLAFTGATIDAANNRLLVGDISVLDFELTDTYDLSLLANGVGGGVASTSVRLRIQDDPSDNAILPTADIYYSLDTDANNENGSLYNGEFVGVGEVIEGSFGATDRNGNTLAMGFPTARVGLEPSGYTSDIHNGTFNVSMWIQLTRAGSGDRKVFEFNCGVNEAVGVFFETTTGILWIRQQNAAGTASRINISRTLYTSVNDNATDWVFLSLSISRDEIRSYIRALNTTSFDSNLSFTGDDILYAGNSSTSTNLSFSGQRCNNAASAAMVLDDLTIFNRALTEDEMIRLYTELSEQ